MVDARGRAALLNGSAQQAVDAARRDDGGPAERDGGRDRAACRVARPQGACAVSAPCPDRTVHPYGETMEDAGRGTADVGELGHGNGGVAVGEGGVAQLSRAVPAPCQHRPVGEDGRLCNQPADTVRAPETSTSVTGRW